MKLNSKGLVFGYNKQYFRLHTEYTEEEMLNLQKDIISIILNGSQDIAKDLTSTIIPYYIGQVLQSLYARDIIGRKGLPPPKFGRGTHLPSHRYFTFE